MKKESDVKEKLSELNKTNLHQKSKTCEGEELIFANETSWRALGVKCKCEKIHPIKLCSSGGNVSTDVTGFEALMDEEWKFWNEVEWDKEGLNN